MIDGLIMDYDLGSKPSQLEYINKRNHKSSSMSFFSKKELSFYVYIGF